MNINRQSGLSLVEILVALIISLFLLGGVVEVYVGNSASYKFSEALSRIQENSRFAMDIIQRDLRMAGARGCATNNFQNNLNPAGTGYSAALHDFFNKPAIEGTENDGLNGSDSLKIRGAAPGQANIIDPINIPTSNNINANLSGFIKANDIVLLANCTGADVFQVNSITEDTVNNTTSLGHNFTGSPGPGNTNLKSGCTTGHCLSQTYGVDSAIFKMQTVTYSIETGESGEPALFRTEFSKKEELVDGIEELQILYGINTDAPSVNTTPNQYLTSDNVTDWTQVTAVRIMILARSPNNVSLDKPQKYTFNDVSVTSPDNLLRQVFTSTIALRNIY